MEFVASKKMLYGTAVAFLLFGNHMKMYYYSLAIIDFLLQEVELWTYLVILMTLIFTVIIIGAWYLIVKQEIKRLSYVNYLTEEECEEMKCEVTRRELEKLKRNPRFLEVKREMERQAQ